MYTHFKRKLNTALKFLTSCRFTPNSTVVHAPGPFCTNARKFGVGIADSLPQKSLYKGCKHLTQNKILLYT